MAARMGVIVRSPKNNKTCLCNSHWVVSAGLSIKRSLATTQEFIHKTPFLSFARSVHYYRYFSFTFLCFAKSPYLIPGSHYLFSYIARQAGHPG